MIFYQLQINELPEKTRESHVNIKSYLIYIVDDDESVRRALKRLFKSVGLEVETFASAGEFLNAGHTDSLSCLILDVKMPGISGLELQERLNAEVTKMPIIFISAYQEKEISAKAMKAGAKAFLSKPFDDQTLLDEVYSALGIESR